MGYGKKWEKLSSSWLDRYPICVLCLAYGHVNKGLLDFRVHSRRGLVVDHIEPHKGDRNLFWDQGNWETLCRMPCHDRDKKIHERSGLHASEWYDKLRGIVEQRQSWKLVSEMSLYLPTHIREQIGEL